MLLRLGKVYFMVINWVAIRVVLSYRGYTGMCGPRGYGILAVLVIGIDFGHFGQK